MLCQHVCMPRALDPGELEWQTMVFMQCQNQNGPAGLAGHFLLSLEIGSHGAQAGLLCSLGWPRTPGLALHVSIFVLEKLLLSLCYSGHLI